MISPVSEPNDPGGLAPERVLDLVTLLTRAVARWGERSALTFDETGRTLTFRELDERTNRVANALHACGLQPGARVALMLRNRPEFPIAWLGVVKAGATMVPLNVFYRSADAGYIIDHAQVDAIITAEEFLEVVELAAPRIVATGHVFCVDGDAGGRARDLRALLDGASSMPARTTVRPESLANIQYTSGTTGMPKGCLLTNGWFLRFAWRVTIAQDGLCERDVLLTAQPFYYVDPQWVLTVALLSGARMVVLDRFHPSTFWEKVREHRVTWFYCLGVMPKLLLKQPVDPAERDHSMRFVLCSAIPPEDHRAIEERWGVPWYEAFGMTESGLDITVHPDEHDRLVGTGCIGRPMPTREARIVGPDDAPLPPGEVGELVLRGLGLMDGYHNNPQATAETFRNGWLHTGDLARTDEAGRFYYVGRMKDMIRRSGENIAAAEVEGVITQHEAVKFAACMPVPDELREEEIKAYVVLQPGQSPQDTTPDTLAAFCEARLAYFKVPRYWCYRDDLPRTASERVRKEVLKEELADLRIGAYDRVEKTWRH